MDIPPGITFILSRNYDEPDTYESNAVGKTTLLRAICFGLYGETADGLGPTDLLCRMAGPRQGLKVVLDFSGGVCITRIQASNRKNTVTFHNGRRLIEGDKRVVDKAIQEHFKCTLQLFKAALYLSQRDSTSSQFLSAKPSERSFILSELVDDRVWQKASELLASEAREKEQLAEAAKTKLIVMKRNLQSLESNLAHISQTLATAARVEDERIVKLKERLVEVRGGITRETAIELDAGNRAIDPKKLEAKRLELSRNIDSLSRQLMEVPSIPPPLDMGATCPACRSVVSADTVETVIEMRVTAEKKRLDLKDELTELNKQLIAVSAHQTRYREWQHRVSLARDRRDRFKTEEAHLVDELSRPVVSLIALAEQERTLKAEVAQKAAEAKQVESEAVDEGEKVLKLRRLATGFKHEIRNLLFDRIRDELDQFTSSYLLNLAGGSARVEYSQGSRGREEFVIDVYSEDNQVQALEAFSGGEYWRITLSILFGLRDVLTLKSGCILPLLLIDDPVGPVDPLGLTNFFSILTNLIERDSARTILVTVPDEGVATTGNVVRIERRGGLASIVGN